MKNKFIDKNPLAAAFFDSMFYKCTTFIGSIEDISKQIANNLQWDSIVNVDLKQAKTHRKKRINKKWQRRYGYICKVLYED